MKIMKFGGTSVGSPQAIEQLMAIVLKVQKQTSAPAVVVSAFSGVTDQLIQMAFTAAKGDEQYRDLLDQMEKRHLDAVKKLLAVRGQSGVLANVKMLFNQLDDVLHGVFLVKELTARTQDFIMSFGERLSAFIISEAFKDRGTKAEFLDAREVVKTDETFGSAQVDFAKTNKLIRDYFSKHKVLQVVTGFIGSTLNGETTTLGRGGSDYTASIFGAALKAAAIEIWTDVDGVMTADPRKVKKAMPIQFLLYVEAMEMAHFGAKVIHPPTMQPAMEQSVPIHIKNTFNPDSAGTVIAHRPVESNYLIQGISSIHDITLLRVQGSGMVGVAGISMRLFGVLARQQISVIMITQASSEHSICVAVHPRAADLAKKTIEEEFALEIQAKRIDEVMIERDLSIIAIVGTNMRNRVGVAGKLLQSLGRNGINVVAMAQGSSELNISVVINSHNETKALNVVHDAFFLAGTKSSHIFLVGTGLIGATLLKKIERQRAFLQKEYLLDVRVIGIANSRKMHFQADGIPLSSWREALEQTGTPMDLEQFVAKIKELNVSNSVFVDCTASETVPRCYEDLLKANVAVVTPNKKANSGSLAYYRKLKDTATRYGAQFLYETNVGAGLPVIRTLHDLFATGDKILKIEAVLSGTLSYIFNTFVGPKKFSEVVKEAKEKGYTEPDPRDDLSGTDVARKILILAREVGYDFELKDVKVESLLSSECQKAKSVPAFFEQLKKMDRSFEQLKKKAEKEQKFLRYIATLEKGQATVSLQLVARSHPFAAMSGSDNIIAFTTEYYKNTPLVIKGPGAGADVTAGGVFADIISISYEKY